MSQQTFSLLASFSLCFGYALNKYNNYPIIRLRNIAVYVFLKWPYQDFQSCVLSWNFATPPLRGGVYFVSLPLEPGRVFGTPQ